MTRAQRYIATLMESVSEGHIASDEHRLTFAKIREKLMDAEDYEGELRSLYRVHGMGEFAMSLMWLSERIEADAAKGDHTVEELSLVVDRFREAVGDAAPAPLGDFSAPPAAEAPQEAAPEAVQETAPEQPSDQPAEESLEMPAHLQMETAGHIDESEKSVYAPPANVDENEFGPLMEKFVESMQSGSDDRESLLNSVMGQSNAIVAPGSGAADDLKEFCQYLIEFLAYITENGFMDDVRVMNILSNVSSPVSSWTQAAPEARQGLLTEGIEMLKSFKSLFE